MNDFSHRIFVYGSLLKGNRNHGMIADCVYQGACKIKGYFMMDMGAFPAIIPTESQDWCVHGEVYRASPRTLENLDVLEGVSSKLYVRVTEDTPWGKAHVYVLHPLRFRDHYQSRRILINDRGDYRTNDWLEFNAEDMVSSIDTDYLLDANITGTPVKNDMRVEIESALERQRRIRRPVTVDVLKYAPTDTLQGEPIDTSDYPKVAGGLA